jgi:Na+-transporting NADH:ubiquinone oxidoreductase subunit NqrE
MNFSDIIVSTLTTRTKQWDPGETSLTPDFLKLCSQHLVSRKVKPAFSVSIKLDATPVSLIFTITHGINQNLRPFALEVPKIGLRLDIFLKFLIRL